MLNNLTTINNNICFNTEITSIIAKAGIFLTMLKILIPIMIIIYGTMDFVKATTNKDYSASKEATKTLTRRTAAGILIFFIPTIMSFAMSLISHVAPKENEFLSCTNCLFNSKKCKEDVELLEKANKKEEDKKDNIIFIPMNNKPDNNTSNESNNQSNNSNNNNNSNNSNNSNSNNNSNNNNSSGSSSNNNQPNNSTTETITYEDSIIKEISRNGLILNIKAEPKDAPISGYYFSYNNQLPDKATGGYIATSNNSIDLIRLSGTTYIWTEDTNGKISGPDTITISPSEIATTTGKKYKILKGTSLSDYLASQGWSVDELNKLMARSVRAAGLYTKEAVATSALSLTHVLAQKYKIKIPYQSAGLRTVPGARDKWGASNSRAQAENEKYYGLDCSAFANWVYANAGFGVNSRVYYWGSSIPRIAYSEANGDIGDVLVYGYGSQSGRHVRLIVGKTSDSFIIAEASGSGVAITTQKFSKDGDYLIQKADYLIDVNKNTDYYINTNYPSGF